MYDYAFGIPKKSLNPWTRKTSFFKLKILFNSYKTIIFSNKSIKNQNKHI